MGKATTVATGAKAAIHAGTETSWGEPVSPTHLIDFTSESMTAEEDTLESEAITSSRGKKFLLQGNLDIGGDVSFEQAAEGYGLLLRHALGDYIRLQRTDGGVHGRMDLDEMRTITSDPDGNDHEIITMSEDHSGGFEVGDKLAFVYRDGNDILQQDPDTTTAAAGYAFESYCEGDSSYIDDIDTSAVDPMDGTTSVTAVEVAGKIDFQGQETEPDFSKFGGVVLFGPEGYEYDYYYAESVGGSDGNIKLYITPNQTLDSSIEAGDSAVLKPCFATLDGSGNEAGNNYTVNETLFSTQNATLGSTNEIIDKGTFVYLYDDDDGTGEDWSSVWTHHMARGEELPIGLTVEVDRDAAVFLYSGLKIDSLSLDFETNSIVSGTFTFIGRDEHVVDTLVDDVPPITDDSSDTTDGRLIKLKGETAKHWPNPESSNQGNTGASTGHSHLNFCEITIGEETGLKYVEKIVNSDGTVDLEMADPALQMFSQSDQIERYHENGAGVALRTSTKVQSPHEGNVTPLTSFETNVYLDGTFEEALSGSLTLNNNINGDKFGLGQKERFQLAAEAAELEASLTFEFDDPKHYKRYREAEFFALEFKCISEADDSLIGSTSVPSQTYYLLPKCKYDGQTPTVDDESFLQSDFPVSPVLDTELNNKDLIAIVVNGKKEDAKT